jgi:hypothetical protein
MYWLVDERKFLPKHSTPTTAEAAKNQNVDKQKQGPRADAKIHQ